VLLLLQKRYEAVKRAAAMTDRSLAALVRWAAIKYLRELSLLPSGDELGKEGTDNETLA